MSMRQACEQSIAQLEEMSRRCAHELEAIDAFLQTIDTISSPANNPLNYVLPVIYGGLGATIASSEGVNRFVNDIHDRQAKSGGVIGALLGHDGDNIDTMPGADGARYFINRAGGTAEIGAHRLLWGHDVFSTAADNPIAVLTRQHGALRGVLRVFQHLTADTFSKQGLPIPFHSHFDTVSEGALNNRLLDFAQNAATDSDGLSKYQAFNNLFTIKFADVATTGLSLALCAAHNHVLNREDEVARTQVKVLALSSQFFARAVYGFVQTGVPFISWPTAVMVIKEMVALYRKSWGEIHRLEAITQQLLAENIALEHSVFADGKSLPSHKNAAGYIKEFHSFNARMNDHTDFFENL